MTSFILLYLGILILKIQHFKKNQILIVYDLLKAKAFKEFF